ncbi:nuclear factor erythroid 2-related factor 1-like [Sesbania bispinosa]|nr:nuclear factor erythroid 2-related factor 1-like [Sesbania bispinosa]
MESVAFEGRPSEFSDLQRMHAFAWTPICGGRSVHSPPFCGGRSVECHDRTFPLRSAAAVR